MGVAALFTSQPAAAWGPPPHFHETALTSSLLVAKPSGNFSVSTFLDLLFLMLTEPFLRSLGFYKVLIYDLAHLSSHHHFYVLGHVSEVWVSTPLFKGAS